MLRQLKGFCLRVHKAVIPVALQWTSLKKLYSQRISGFAKFAAVFCPLLAMILDAISKYGGLSENDISYFVNFIPEELFVAYLVSVFYSGASIMFSTFCPEDIRKYNKFRDYAVDHPEEADGVKLRGQEELVSKIQDIVVHEDEVDNETTSVLTRALVASLRDKVNPSLNWERMNDQGPLLRFIITALFGTSIIITLIAVVWTTPREVFQIISVWDVFQYLFQY